MFQPLGNGSALLLPAQRALTRRRCSQFKAFDVDNSKVLDADEFGKAVAIMHINLDPRGLNELFKEIDTSNSGDLDQNEWMRMMERSRKKLVGAHGPKITWEKLCQFVTNVVVDDSGLTQQDAKPLDTGARAGGGPLLRADFELLRDHAHR